MMTMNKSWYLMLAAFAAFCAFDAFAGIVYVSATSGDDSNDGSSWALAKQTIQAGVDAAASNDMVLVTNGTYNTGSRLPPGQVMCKTRVVIDKAISVISANGPSNTFIVGQGPLGDNAIRCVWMTNGSVISGFTLTNGYTTTLGEGYESEDSGGGAWCNSNDAVLTNCVLVGNSANSGGGVYQGLINNCIISNNTAVNIGGGAYKSTLNDSALTDNSTSLYGGGGAYVCILNRCTLTGNTAVEAGGAFLSTLNNCTLTSNSANIDAGGAGHSTLNNCTLIGNSAGRYGGGGNDSTMNNCALIGNSAAFGGGACWNTLNNCTLTRNSANNSGGGMYHGTARNTIFHANTNSEYDSTSTSSCYTNDPYFIDVTNGNYRLRADSLCINSGLNTFAPTNISPFDLDGNPRIAQLTVDIGAYEYQGIEFYDIFASAGTHGSITPSGVIRTNQGADVPFAIQPDAYYHVQNVLTNGGSAGTATNFTWYNLSGPGTVTVSFAATLATRGTPHWWLAQWGWTNDFDIVEALDQDGDGLFTWEEYPHNTCPTNANTDGDQYADGVEVGAGADPLQDDSQTYGAMLAHPASFNLYTSNSVLDLSYGDVMLNVVSNTIQVSLTMQSTDLLDGDKWTNVGAAVEWECPADLNKSFFRFLGTPVE